MVAFLSAVGGPLSFGGSIAGLTVTRTARCTPRVSRSRFAIRAMAEEVETKVETKVKTPVVPVEMEYEENIVQKWVADTEQKIDVAKAKIGKAVDEFDPEAFQEDVVENSTTLFDNLVNGEWLGRGEMYGGVQVAFAFFLLQNSTSLDGVANFVFGPVVLLAGMVLSGKAAFDLGVKQLSIWPKPNEKGSIITEGLYSYVRHPVYAGLIMSSLGWSAVTHSPARFAISVAFALFLERKMQIEEEFLREAYPDYEKYEKEVPYKILPKVF